MTYLQQAVQQWLLALLLVRASAAVVLGQRTLDDAFPFTLV
jgi:hypothetical protein